MKVRIKYFIIISAMLLFTYFLYSKTNTIDLEKHNQLLSEFNQFMLIDSTLNQNILEIRQGLLSFYDPTVGKTAQLETIISNINKLLTYTQTDKPQKLTPLIETSIEVLANKKRWIEQFKSTNAVFTNSLRYLPIATNQLATKLPLDSQGDIVTLLLTEQLRDILIHNYSNDNVILDKFNETNKLLMTVFKKHYSELLNELNSLQSHAEIVITKKILIDNIVSKIIQTPSSTKMNQLLNEYLVTYNKNMRTVKQYQKALYGFSILLLTYLFYTLYKLNISGKKLKRTIKSLNYQKFSMDQHAIVSVTDEQGIIIYANQKFLDITGYTSDEVLGKTHASIKTKHHPVSFFKSSHETNDTDEVWHGIIQNRNKNNELYWVDTTSVPFRNEEGKTYQIVTIQTDITDIKNAQEKLNLQATALEVAPNGIVITDKNAHILWANNAFSKITGYQSAEFINQELSLLNSGKQSNDFYKNMWDTILDDQAWHGELINRRKDGSLYPEEMTIAPVKNSFNEITHFISIKQDISQRRLTEEALRRSQKMDAIGQLSGGIAHDFNNQLGIVLGYLDIIKGAVSDNGQTAKYIEIASKATLRCIELTRQLLSFSRIQTIESSTLNINHLLREQELIITRTMTPEIKVEYDLAENIWNIKSNAGEFQDTILNIALNARDAMLSGGKLSLITSNEVLSQNNPDIPAGDYVMIIITDTGVGMSDDVLEHIYDPFFTTKPVDKGTGLGMSMVYGYIKRNNGHIKITSTQGEGTSIHIYLPRAHSISTL